MNPESQTIGIQHLRAFYAEKQNTKYLNTRLFHAQYLKKFEKGIKMIFLSNESFAFYKKKKRMRE